MDKKPWEVNPNLTEERLMEVSRLLAEVRDSTNAGQDLEAGDDSWGTGCQIYARCCNRLVMAGTSLSWLKPEKKGTCFRMYVGPEPVRFYTGDPNRPIKSRVNSGVSDLQQKLELPEEFQLPNDGWFWLVCVETDGSGHTLRIVWLQSDSLGHTRNHWAAPVTAVAPAVTSTTKLERPAVKLPKPKVGLKLIVKPKKADGDSDGEG